jgi:hypothetical protein
MTGALPVALSRRRGRPRGWRVGVRDGATGSRTAMGVGDDDGGTADGVEAEGGDGAASREAAA